MMEKLNFNKYGLIPAVIQDAKAKKVLTLCYMNKEALKKSFSEGIVYVFRRSKRTVLAKGEISGCFQRIKKVFVDCEGNSLLFLVDQKRAACHKGYFTCYFRRFYKNGNVKVEAKRIFNPKDVYCK